VFPDASQSPLPAAIQSIDSNFKRAGTVIYFMDIGNKFENDNNNNNNNNNSKYGTLSLSVILQLGTLYQQLFETNLHQHPVSAAISKLNYVAGYMVTDNSSQHVRDSFAIRMSKHKLSHLQHLLTYIT